MLSINTLTVVVCVSICCSLAHKCALLFISGWLSKSISLSLYLYPKRMCTENKYF